MLDKTARTRVRQLLRLKALQSVTLIIRVHVAVRLHTPPHLRRLIAIVLGSPLSVQLASACDFCFDQLGQALDYGLDLIPLSRIAHVPCCCKGPDRVGQLLRLEDPESDARRRLIQRRKLWECVEML